MGDESGIGLFTDTGATSWASCQMNGSGRKAAAAAAAAGLHEVIQMKLIADGVRISICSQAAGASSAALRSARCIMAFANAQLCRLAPCCRPVYVPVQVHVHQRSSGCEASSCSMDSQWDTPDCCFAACWPVPSGTWLRAWL
jgi:hypothetical protein